MSAEHDDLADVVRDGNRAQRAMQPQANATTRMWPSTFANLYRLFRALRSFSRFSLFLLSSETRCSCSSGHETLMASSHLS